MKHFLLIYDYVPDYMDKRTPFRPAHFAAARAAAGESPAAAMVKTIAVMVRPTACILVARKAATLRTRREPGMNPASAHALSALRAIAGEPRVPRC